MMEVFVFGVFVAYVKLSDLVTIGLATGVYALMALTFVLVWIDSMLDREAVWERLDRRSVLMPPVSGPLVSCEVCGLVGTPNRNMPHCPRCGAVLHRRKPNAIARTWALLIAAAILYVPANYYPVLTVVQLGAGEPSTILGGVRELVSSGMYPLAALVFFASILVPGLKLVGLTIMLVTTQPGMGALAFCAVVILTMFAAETCDPRLMWDAADEAGVRMGSLSRADQLEQSKFYPS